MEATPPPQPPAAPASAAYPVRVDAVYPTELNRFLPLVKWLLAFPHYFVLGILGIAVFFAKIYAFFHVLFTGRYPEGVFIFVRNWLNWAWDVTAYIMLLHDDYPPFSLEREGRPTTLEIDYPANGIANWRPLVHWILIFPFAFLTSILAAVAGFVAFIGIFVILFTGALPQGMFKLILIPNRWNYRTVAYAGYMVDRYPPFDWDE